MESADSSTRGVDPGRDPKLGDRLVELSLPVQDVAERFVSRVISAAEPDRLAIFGFPAALSFLP